VYSETNAFDAILDKEATLEAYLRKVKPQPSQLCLCCGMSKRLG